MKFLVDLNNKVDAFNLREEHKQRLLKEFPQHQFEFCESYSHFKENIAEAEGALVWLFSQRLYEKAEKLELLFTPAAGHDWVAADPQGKVKCHFGSFHGHMISESFLTMLFLNNNRALKAIENFKKASWDRNYFGKRSLLKNQSLLILGCGNIGRICAEKAALLGMKVAGVRRSPEKESFPVYSYEQLPQLIGSYDHVLNLLPGSEETFKLVSSEFFNLMKKGASFYNFGRGTTVDETALKAAVINEHLSFAGLDVTFEEPLAANSSLWELPNTLITPHSSCCYEDYLHLFIDELKEKL